MGLRHQVLPGASGSPGPSLGSPRAGKDSPGGGCPAGLRRLDTQNGGPWEMLGEGMPQRLFSRSRGQAQQGAPCCAVELTLESGLGVRLPRRRHSQF